MSQQFPTTEGKNNSIYSRYKRLQNVHWTHKTYESRILDEKRGFSDQLFFLQRDKRDRNVVNLWYIKKLFALMAQGVRFSSIFQRESTLLKKWSSVISVWERSPWSCPDLVADHVFDDVALHHVWSRIFPKQAVISGWDHETTSRSTFWATVETWVAHYGRLLTAGATLYVNLKGYCSQMQTHHHYYDYFWWH